ncbi:murein transglycosylase [Pilimelia anulata]|uniref:Murein transglycosylase n=1 Tax=Pilimelia anulata TaxID=53371 RepID=A0A8J3F914_9ACTN|nr:lytic murein transglycosylase [Pilimelia anulata]GGJ91802.1 murein transglycosylase [Pilimelia anulata]
MSGARAGTDPAAAAADGGAAATERPPGPPPRVRAATPDAAVTPGRPAVRPGTPADAARHRGAAAPPPHRTLGGWLRHPGVGLAAPYLVMVALIAASVLTGGLLPDLRDPPAADAAPTTNPTPTLDGGALPTGGPTGTGAPTFGPTGLPPTGTTGRPADTLRGWAAGLATRTVIPPTALEAYGYAELVVGRTLPRCRLSWTTLAAIGLVESGHGSHNGAQLGPDGKALPTIIGLPLDGKEGRAPIKDTDRGVLDGDKVWDRAVGPMQFIPTTWQRSGADGDGDGIKDPNDLDDAALAAGQYLCAGGRDLGDAAQWWRAILAYNNLAPYAQKVYTTANDYGVRSRS